ncbi:hypothetical protein N9B82_05975 [Saprospiraceae bacterium]|nr:hypothetical protein [Saprospiraceae bacterium]
MKTKTLLILRFIFCSIQIYSQKPNIGLGLEKNYVFDGLNLFVRGEIALSKRIYSTIRVGRSTRLKTEYYNGSLGLHRLIFLNNKIPIWIGVNATRDIFISKNPSPSFNFIGIEVPLGIGYHFSSGLSPYLEIAYGRSRDFIFANRMRKATPVRVRAGVKYTIKYEID